MSLHNRVLLAPHFPILLKEEEEGIAGPIQMTLKELGQAYRAAGVEVVVILSAHWDEEGPLQVDNGARHKTLLDFEGVETSLHYTCDGWVELGNALHENGLANGLPVETVHRGMDHSASVPLSFLFPEADRRVVPLSTSPRSRDDLRLWGEVVRETCRGAGAECAVVVGGSLSYDPPGHQEGRDPDAGKQLDRAILSHLETGNWDGLEALPAELTTGGKAHVQLRHLWFLEGILGGPVAGRVLAYEHHPSVGSALVEFLLHD